MSDQPAAAPTTETPETPETPEATDKPATPEADTPATDTPASDTAANLEPATPGPANTPAERVADPPADAAAARSPDATPTAAEPAGHEPAGHEPAGDEPHAPKKKRTKKKAKGDGAGGAGSNRVTPDQVTRRIGATTAKALAYLDAPDPQLSRLSRKVSENLLPDLPPVVAGALLGPGAMTRHLVASAAAGRYRDLFALWDVFRAHPAAAKPELSERQPALAKGRAALRTATRLGLTGRHAHRVAEDIAQAEGLIWQWLREALIEHRPLLGRRPAVASALLQREPDLELDLPAQPDDDWLAEAAAARVDSELAPAVDALLAANAHRLPATVSTLRLATRHYPDRVAALIDRVDLDSPDIGAFLAWARDHGAADRLHGRIREQVAGAAARDRVEGLALWYRWAERGVALELPASLHVDDLEGFDLSRPETAALAARLVAAGKALDPQEQLDAVAAANTQRGEKAYEAMVCADLDVALPRTLEGNPAVRDGTRCPNCRAWTWVRPGHEQRCPRPPAPAAEPELDAFELAAAEVASPGGK